MVEIIESGNLTIITSKKVNSGRTQAAIELTKELVSAGKTVYYLTDDMTAHVFMHRIGYEFYKQYSRQIIMKCSDIVGDIQYYIDLFSAVPKDVVLVTDLFSTTSYKMSIGRALDQQVILVK